MQKLKLWIQMKFSALSNSITMKGIFLLVKSTHEWNVDHISFTLTLAHRFCLNFRKCRCCWRKNVNDYWWCHLKAVLTWLDRKWKTKNDFLSLKFCSFIVECCCGWIFWISISTNAFWKPKYNNLSNTIEIKI